MLLSNLGRNFRHDLIGSRNHIIYGVSEAFTDRGLLKVTNIQLKTENVTKGALVDLNSLGNEGVLLIPLFLLCWVVLKWYQMELNGAEWDLGELNTASFSACPWL